MIACSHPGRMGDALYALPSVIQACERHGCKCDFYTSEWCKPISKLLKRQSYIDKVVIPPEYTIQEHSIGIQPWKMPIDEAKYEAVYQFGFKTYPLTFLADHIANENEFLPKKPLKLEYDDLGNEKWGYFVTCTKSVNDIAYYNHLDTFFEQITRVKDVVIVGLQKIRHGGTTGCTDWTGMAYENIPGLIHNSDGFIGVPSTPHTIATFIPHVKRYVVEAPYWDTRHVFTSNNDLVTKYPSVEEALKFFGINEEVKEQP